MYVSSIWLLIFTYLLYAVAAMQNYAINNKLTPFISMQNHYNLVYREEEREMFPTLKVCLRCAFRYRLAHV